MYNYVMYVMFAIDQEREKENNRRQGTKSREQLTRERMGAFQSLLGTSISNLKEKDTGMITIEITPEDMKKAKEEKKKRDKDLKERKLTGKPKPNNKNSLPSGSRSSSSGK